MGEWREYKLGDVAEVQTGPFGSQLHASDYVPSGIPAIMPTNIGPRLDITLDAIAYVREKDVQRLNKYTVQEGDIVYSRRGDVEKCAYIKKEHDGWLCGTGCLRIRLYSEDVLPQFFAYYLSTPEIKAWVSNSAIGTTMSNLNSKVLWTLPLIIPDLSEQKSIASVLGSLDDKIDLLHRQNKTLEALAETLFRQWFVEEAEEGWETGALGSVIELIYGKGLKEDKRSGTGFPVVGSSGIVGYHSEFLAEGPGIVIGRKGTLGKVIYLFDSFFPIDTTYFVRSKINSTGLYYEYFLLKSLNFEDMNSDSAVPGLNRDLALAIEIVMPKHKKIAEFNTFCSPLFEKLKANNGHITTLTRLRDTLLPRLMSGEVRVKDTKFSDGVVK